MRVQEIYSIVTAVVNDRSLFNEHNFYERSVAIESLEFHVIERIDSLQRHNESQELLSQLRHEAVNIKHRLEEIDSSLFQHLREKIRRDHLRGDGFKKLVDSYVDRNSSRLLFGDTLGYDTLDLFVNGLLLSQPIPTEATIEDAEMVFYQQTPTRIVFELAAKINCDDVLYDLGSGLGHVPVLVHLLTGVRATGIEIEPDYCAYANAVAVDLKLSCISYVNVDARIADYTSGSAFFLYTPFRGSILELVLERLRQQAKHKSIRIFSYGPCTVDIANANWLERISEPINNDAMLAEFRSVVR